MIITSNIINKKYKDGCSVHYNSSHYHDIHKDILIYLPDVLENSIKDRLTINHVLIQHIAHETLHKVLDEHISNRACTDFDNICSEKVQRIEGKYSLKHWSGGLYEGKRKK